MCGYTCVRYLVFFFNVIFFITGIGLIGSGTYLHVEKDDYLDLCDKYSFVTGANILIAVGVIVVIVAFFGCYGAFKESTCMLGIFFAFLFLIFVLELAAGIYSAIKRNKVEDEIQTCLNGTLNKAGTKELWDKFQEEFDCCGVNSSADYHGNAPKSCGKTQAEANKKKGCQKEFESYIKNNLVVVIGVGIGFAMIQILGMVMSLWMICQIKSRGDLA